MTFNFNSFVVQDKVETRNDNPELRLYRVFLDHYKYILCYEKDQLKEVYFMNRFKNYFMSCRTDFKTISHYYVSIPYIKRYEQGVCNRIYTMKSATTTTCQVDNIERVYTLFNRTVDVNLINKFYTDLTTFLIQFYALELDQQFFPKQPS